MNVELNINDQCTVVLTVEGAAYYTAYSAQFAPMVTPRKYLSGEVLRMPLWDLANIFGPKLIMGSRPMFENNRVTVHGDQRMIIEGE